jgi:hypothetical protein
MTTRKDTPCSCGEIVWPPGTLGRHTYNDVTNPRGHIIHRTYAPCDDYPEMGPLDHLAGIFAPASSGYVFCGDINDSCVCSKQKDHKGAHACGEITCWEQWPNMAAYRSPTYVPPVIPSSPPPVTVVSEMRIFSLSMIIQDFPSSEGAIDKIKWMRTPLYRDT